MTFTSNFPDHPVPRTSLSDHVLSGVRGRGGEPAVVDGASGATLSHRDLLDAVRRCAAGLAARGWGRGDVLAVMLPNVADFVIAYQGALVAGMTVSTLSPLSAPAEATFQLADTGAVAVVTAPPFLATARAAAAAAGDVDVLVTGATGDPGGASLPAVDGPWPSPDVDPAADVAALLYSSGTTGTPKAVELTHRAMVAALTQLEPVVPMLPTDVVLCPIPLFHIAGQSAGMNAVLHAGATTVLMARFDPEEMFALVERHRATVLVAAPPIVRLLAGDPRVDRYDLSSLRAVVSGSAPLSASLQSACADRLGRLVGQAYGMTETGLIISASPHDRPVRPGSAGMLVPNTEARLVDPATGTDAAPGAPGELWVRGPQLMRGYRGRPDATAATIDADGWLHTGDLVRIDEDGWLHVTDRLKDLIKYNGYQVCPAELEAVLGDHPAVADVVVAGCPDEQVGEIPTAFVVRRGEVAESDLIEHVAARVSPQRRIRAVTFVEAIPRSPAGKVLRRRLVGTG